MNNRMAIGLAVGAGYVLGRTRKAKLALGLGALVMGRRLTPDAAAVGSYLGDRLGDHPGLKDLREQLREDLAGVGSAAFGALVDRQLEAVADRLHARTLGVQERLTSSGRAGSAERDGKPAARATSRATSKATSTSSSPSGSNGRSTSRSAGGSAGRARTAKRTGGRKAEAGGDG
ncbi:DNA primase [Streptomyces sp. R33]|uniref:DNA primase n=1 Tax=Streptomyces sp. R33 TaxID=3238629 RepID=A0AB39YG45_9ACTN